MCSDNVLVEIPFWVRYRRNREKRMHSASIWGEIVFLFLSLWAKNMR